MSFTLQGINWLAVGAGALAAFFLGALWYQALFGKAWIRLNGYTDEQVKKMAALRPPPVFFGGMLAAYFVASLTIALLLNREGVTPAGGAMLGALAGAGIAAAVGFTGWLASDKPLGLWLINASFDVVMFVVMGSIIGAWR